MENASPAPPPDRRGRTARLLAVVVLIPTVPLLLLSVGALALFYLAPARFGNWIARLPGDQFIRSALAFAPVTLFAVLILAVLYVLERPESAAGPAPAAAAWAARGLDPRWIGRLILLPALTLLVLSASALLFSFIAPGRYERLIDALPGTRFLRPAVQAAPFLLLLLVLGAGALALFGGRPARPRPRLAPVSLARIAAIAALIAALPLLLASLAALALFYLSPGRFEALIARLSVETFVRVGLIFAPVTLLAVAFLAALYLLSGSMGSRLAAREGAGLDERGATLALWVLGAGLAAVAVLVVGLLAAILLSLRLG